MALAKPAYSRQQRRARMCPAGPTVSPTGCRMPYFAGIAMSLAMSSRLPGVMLRKTKSASLRPDASVLTARYLNFETVEG